MMNKTTIGVDARLLSEDITGIGRYLFETLTRMVELDFNWNLYSHKSVLLGNWDLPNVKIFQANFNSRPSRMIWAQSYLPYLSSRNNDSLFWSPSHRLPYFLVNSIPSVVTIHDLVWLHAGSTMRKSSRFLDSFLMRQAVLDASSIITVSNSTLFDLHKYEPKTFGKASTIYLGCDSFKPATDNNGPKFSQYLDKSFILFVGTLEPRKNLLRLIEAFSKIQISIRKDIRLVIVGGYGWGGINPTDIANQFNLKGLVDVLGYVDDNFLSYLYSNALFLAMPSLYEGFGLPLIEAMKYGTPCLTSNISSMPEVIDTAGLLVDPYSVDSIANGMIQLILDSKLRSDLRLAALNRSKIFRWDNTANKTFELFTRVLRDPVKKKLFNI